MIPLPDTNTSRSQLYAVAESMLAMISCPAAIVLDREHVVVCNMAWSTLTGCNPASTGPVAMEACVQEFAGGAHLVAALRAESQFAGTATLRRSASDSSEEEGERTEYTAKWGLVRDPVGSHTYTVVVLEPEDMTANLISVIDAQRVTINHLLVRQTLIEERERRSIGRAMHDDVVQELALVRLRLSQATEADDHLAGLRDNLDAVINRVREMAFELSPPILEDLGLLPALRWLAEHMGKRYQMRIEVAEDAVEPAFGTNTRTIVFRAVRELFVNAAKHAPGSHVVLSCEIDEEFACITVRDTGKGFDASQASAYSPGFKHFGLFSLEQQVRGVGGSFELASAVGAGTQARITVPVKHGKAAFDA